VRAFGDVVDNTAWLYAPAGVAVTATGDVYVADTGNHRIDEFTQSGSFVRAFGKEVNGGDGSDVCTTSCQGHGGSAGSGAGEMWNPYGVAVGPTGDVYVADSSNNRIDEFTQSGGFVRAFGKGVGAGEPFNCTATTGCEA